MIEHWSIIARAAAQVNPSIMFAFANMALEYAAVYNPSLAPYVGTVMNKKTARAAMRAANAAADAAVMPPKAAAWMAETAAMINARIDARVAAAMAARVARDATRSAPAAALTAVTLATRKTEEETAVMIECVIALCIEVLSV